MSNADTNLEPTTTTAQDAQDDPSPTPVELLDPTKIDKWKTKLEKPPVYVPTPATDSQGPRQDYSVTVRVGAVQMLPAGPPLNLPKTKVLAYGGRVTRDDGATSSVEYGSPGATFEMTRGVRARVQWVNEITEPHLLTVDSSPHVPPEAQSKVPYVTHLHGLEVESASDGSPEAWFTANNARTGKDFSSNFYEYPNSQPPTTLWYHDHTIGMTRFNVYAGLAGMYVIRDPQDPVEKLSNGASWLPKGAHEMPLVIQDRSFNTDGSLAYLGGNGDTNVVNGKVWPQMDVERTRYRFRILNGANNRFYDLALSNGDSFTLIGSDGGYLEKPASVKSLLLSPGERADVLIDFSHLKPGTFITLRNHAPGFYPLGVDPTTTGEPIGEVVRFAVLDKAPAVKPLAVPGELTPIPKLPSSGSRRTLTLHDGDDGSSLLDGQSWHAAVSETPRVGTTEDWDIVNLTSLSHPIHVHLVQFQVLGRQGVDTDRYQTDWRTKNGEAPTPLAQPTVKLPVDDYLVENSATGPAPAEAGWKDTVVVNPGSVTRIRIRWAPQHAPATTVPGKNEFPFDPTLGPGYAWHCHILEHEDMDMMRPLKVMNE